MPRRRRKQNMKGKGPLLDKIKGFLKKHRVISRAAGALAPMTGSYAPVIAGVGDFARSQGYGRKRKRGRPRK